MIEPIDGLGCECAAFLDLIHLCRTWMHFEEQFVPDPPDFDRLVDHGYRRSNRHTLE